MGPENASKYTIKDVIKAPTEDALEDAIEDVIEDVTKNPIQYAVECNFVTVCPSNRLVVK